MLQVEENSARAIRDALLLTLDDQPGSRMHDGLQLSAVCLR